ncbi:MAG TPA: MarR family transcriptional regulator [Saprospiraceae bacterium]|nr:MarR family transcriptional regulator [Saprospiraceae bacterium]
MDHTDVLTSLRRIIRTVNLESKRIEKEHGISIPQLLCLNFLKDRPSYQASQKEIKDVLSLNASTVTGIINRLEKKGLIAKLPRRDDRRVANISLTAKGLSLMQETPEPMHLRLTENLGKLSDSELQELRKAFRLISDFLGAGAIDASPILTSETTINKGKSEQEWSNE